VVADTDAQPDSVDVLIVGAGISGIGAAYYLRRDHPQRSYAILEARGASGGTWDLFRYPGVRSDSDLHTFGYEFRPWRSEVAIADADSILDYLRSTAAAYGIDRSIRYNRRVVAASWSSGDARWTVAVEHTDTGERSVVTCNWILCAAGYYRYDEGFTPDFAGRERFRGPVVHPQHWPDGLDYAGKRVVVIGSGATAVTLVPAMAGSAAHVTMVQRTPSYVLPLPTVDKLARRLSALLGEERGFALTRRMNIARQGAIWWFCQRHPDRARRLIRSINARMLPEGYPVDEHFNPPYKPWDQRLCIAADADLFRVIRSGKAEVVTGQIETFTENGVLMKSGRELDADLIVTATGLNVQTIGGMSLTVDGEPVGFADTVTFKGMMASGVPNFAYVFGYTNASWTLKVGVLSEHFCRLLSYMDARGYDTARPVADPRMATKPFLDFDAGYIKRSLAQLPRQGSRAPWLRPPTYRGDVRLLLRHGVADPDLRFSASRSGAARVPDESQRPL
jgi:monooxygenase